VGSKSSNSIIFFVSSRHNHSKNSSSILIFAEGHSTMLRVVKSMLKFSMAIDGEIKDKFIWLNR
jgi:hypothetical protein